MDFKRNRKVINEAIKAGCKTMADLALYLRGTAQLKHA